MKPGDCPPLRVVRPPDRAQASRERLAFNYGPGSVPSRRLVEAVLATEAEPTFATAAYRRTARLGVRRPVLPSPRCCCSARRITLPALGVLHLAELCAIIGIAPMLLHRFARRLPVFRVTPETIGLVVFGLAILATVPFSIWPGGAFAEFTGLVLEDLDRVRADDEHADDAASGSNA